MNHLLYVRIYQAVLKLYPYEFRTVYESEMMSIFSEMIVGYKDAVRRMLFLMKSIAEVMPWIVKENLKQMPSYLLMSGIASVFLVTPFVLIVGYSFYETRILHLAAPPLLQAIEHVWVLYGVVLPVFALLTTVIASFRYLKPQLIQHGAMLAVTRGVLSLPMLVTMALGLVELHIVL